MNENDTFTPRFFEEETKSKTKEVVIGSLDLYTLLSSSIRYSFYRRSYIVSLTLDLLKKHKNDIEDFQFKQIVKEIEEEVDKCERTKSLLGDSINHEIWKKSLIELKSMIKE